LCRVTSLLQSNCVYMQAHASSREFPPIAVLEKVLCTVIGTAAAVPIFPLVTSGTIGGHAPMDGPPHERVGGKAIAGEVRIGQCMPKHET